ncbi:MAG: EAL domain-containing protein [Pseudomonadota bacterium]
MGAHAVRLSNVDIDAALEAGDFEVLFQPIFDLGAGTLARMETFVRWRHRTLGLLPPGAFISFFETQGRMSELTRYVLRNALDAYVGWRGAHPPGFSINLALSDLVDEAFANHFAVVMRDRAFPTEHITFECPMPPVDADAAAAARSYDRLKATGARLAIEVRGRANDFLKSADPFPFDEIKTGGAAILRFARTVRGPGLSAISELLELAEREDAAITAVGVEDQASLIALRGIGFKYAQGNHLGRVGEIADFTPRRVNDVRDLLGLPALSSEALSTLFHVAPSAAKSDVETEPHEDAPLDARAPASELRRAALREVARRQAADAAAASPEDAAPAEAPREEAVQAQSSIAAPHNRAEDEPEDQDDLIDRLNARITRELGQDNGQRTARRSPASEARAVEIGSRDSIESQSAETPLAQKRTPSRRPRRKTGGRAPAATESSATGTPVGETAVDAPPQADNAIPEAHAAAASRPPTSSDDPSDDARSEAPRSKAADAAAISLDASEAAQESEAPKEQASTDPQPDMAGQADIAERSGETGAEAPTPTVSQDAAQDADMHATTRDAPDADPDADPDSDEPISSPQSQDDVGSANAEATDPDGSAEDAPEDVERTTSDAPTADQDISPVADVGDDAPDAASGEIAKASENEPQDAPEATAQEDSDEEETPPDIVGLARATSNDVIGWDASDQPPLPKRPQVATTSLVAAKLTVRDAIAHFRPGVRVMTAIVNEEPNAPPRPAAPLTEDPDVTPEAAAHETAFWPWSDEDGEPLAQEDVSVEDAADASRALAGDKSAEPGATGAEVDADMNIPVDGMREVDEEAALARRLRPSKPKSKPKNFLTRTVIPYRALRITHFWPKFGSKARDESKRDAGGWE